MLNKKLLLKVKAQILAEPRRFDMFSFLARAGESNARKVDSLNPACNTVMCIGGWGIYFSGRMHTKEFESGFALVERFDEISAERYAPAAMEKLGLPNTDLLYTDNWPYGLRTTYLSAARSEDWAQMAAVAARAIDDVIAGHGYFTHFLDKHGDYNGGVNGKHQPT